VGPSVNEIALSFQSRILLDIACSQQDSSLAFQMVHVAVGELLIEREVGEVELGDEIPDAECPTVQLSLPLFR
jgi:hypothetical protein